jgi:C4-dicarboxylate transporter, DcuC family
MLTATFLIVAAAIVLMVYRVDVRLVLLGAGLAMALLARDPLVITDTFTRAMVASMVAPICAAMGFAMVMTATGCDRHLVHLLLRPIRRVRWLVLPGGVLVAYVINMAISSQTSTAAALGPILVPLLLAGGYTPAVAGAALLLGASFGGDLLNPGAQDVQAIAGVVNLPAPELSRRIIPASLAGAAVATITFTALNWRTRGATTETSSSSAPSSTSSTSLTSSEARVAAIASTSSASSASPPSTSAPIVATDETPAKPEEPVPSPAPVPAATPDDAELVINPLRAAIPLVPIALLLLGYAGVPWLAWLVRVPDAPDWKPLANALPVVRAMLIGTAVAAVVCWREITHLTRSFFTGMGEAYGGIISLTITAQCFGAGIAAVGLSAALLSAAQDAGALRPLAAGFPWALSVLSGSGSGPILAFAETFLKHLDPAAPETTKLAALACFGGAFGRTMSPVAAVVVYTSGLTNVSPVLLIRRLLPALLAGGAVALLLAVR